ncbi:metallophosphoesterase [Aureibacter tunicatorum]|uniref:Calcineurin-like phosphoesterase domain-containing protein n=1 Tax=Aureibacter tunicatorum TaxID=866807 RepID=A0AAE3XNR2_9BACT|nr:metallophosphoesterase [Aureibacter tunicatorum]MDR6239333.1 hypothetical protein [Aureibacter tunicatorum]
MIVIPLAVIAMIVGGVYWFWSSFGLFNNVSYSAEIYFVLVALALGGLLHFIFMDPFKRSNPSLTTNIIGGFTFAFIISAIFSAALGLASSLVLGVFGGLSDLAGAFDLGWNHLLYYGALVSFWFGVAIFLGMLYGVFWGRYKFGVTQIELFFDNLPQEFDGYRIAHISDMHLGTFDSIRRVGKGIDKLQAEKPDLILFTGDMVNNIAEEAEPFIDMMKSLKAPDGKYSVLGNHDYASYVPWKDELSKQANLEKLMNIESQMGFKLMMNENIAISKGDSSIKLLGVENWGEPPFPQNGDLNAALSGVDPSDFKILMSHDPTHWSHEVLKHSNRIDLTLAGHTHGMQFGIELGKFRWSPVQYRYEMWGGLYQQMNEYLYVNRGFGHHGFPGRLGIWPEITIITLRKR